MAGLSPDVAAFLARVARLNPAAVVRVRPAGADHYALWSVLPWQVLVTRTISASNLGTTAPAGDLTVRAADWLARPDGDVTAVERRDSAWRGALPTSAGQIRETLQTLVVREISAAAAATLRAVTAGALAHRGLGERAIRDALLDHVPIVVEHDGERVEVPQRLVQAVVQMGFLGADQDPVHIRTTGPWVGVSAAYGVAWWRPQNRLSPTLLPTGVRL